MEKQYFYPSQTSFNTPFNPALQQQQLIKKPIQQPVLHNKYSDCLYPMQPMMPQPPKACDCMYPMEKPMVPTQPVNIDQYQQYSQWQQMPAQPMPYQQWQPTIQQPTQYQQWQPTQMQGNPASKATLEGILVSRPLWQQQPILPTSVKPLEIPTRKSEEVKPEQLMPTPKPQPKLYEEVIIPKPEQPKIEIKPIMIPKIEVQPKPIKQKITIEEKIIKPMLVDIPQEMPCQEYMPCQPIECVPCQMPMMHYPMHCPQPMHCMPYPMHQQMPCPPFMPYQEQPDCMDMWPMENKDDMNPMFGFQPCFMNPYGMFPSVQE